MGSRLPPEVVARADGSLSLVSLIFKRWLRRDENYLIWDPRDFSERWRRA